MRILKRNGNEVQFDKKKIVKAILNANREVEPGDRLDDADAFEIADKIELDIINRHYNCNVEDIQDMVEDMLISRNKAQLAKKYIKYRYIHSIRRDRNNTDNQILSLIDCSNEEIKQENSNKNPIISSVQRDYMAGEVSKDVSRRLLLTDEIMYNHDNGIIHFHDMDYYLQHMHNCSLINLDDMLQNGTVISGTMIEKPHSFGVACTVATQIIAQVASCQYGGQSITLSHLAPFVDISRKKIRESAVNELKDADIPSDTKQHIINKIVEDRLRSEVTRGIQTIQYQVVTLMTTNGQAPFVTIFMYIDEVPEGQIRDDLVMIIEETIKQRIKGVKNEVGQYITPAFPKLIYVLDEDNINTDSKYYYLTKLAARCTAKRMVPDYISAKVMKQLKGEVYPCMGCRSFLTPDRFTDAGVGNISKCKNYDPNSHKYYSRFNQGVVTINLVDVALSASVEMSRSGLLYEDNDVYISDMLDIFWRILDERLSLCHEALKLRHKRLLGTKSDVAPILWQYGALARLDKGETIDKLLYDGYSTISLGYAGLWECVYALINKKLTEPEGEELGLEIMKKLNEYTNKWKMTENIDYSLYGTPIESTTYKFAKCLKKRFGIIPGVTDKNYITNSYHVHVTEKIDAESKLKLESKFQALSPGGAISYVEVPNMSNNIDAVISILRIIYDNIMYAELNTKSDYCQVCGYDGEIQIVEDDDKLVWECPNCKNRDQSKMNVARRTCGYIGSQFWNQGRTEEIKERVLHVD